MTPLPEPLEPAQRPAPSAYAVGYRRPPAGRPFRPGVSGNPLGRPRRATLAPAAGRVVPADPTELERVLAEPVIAAADPSGPVSLVRAVIARLSRRALDDGDVAACRELVRLCAEAEALAAERAFLAAEAEAAAAEAAEAEREAQARRARDRAEARLELMAEEAADDADEARLEGPDRALMLLDAVEIADDEIVAVKPWVIEAARAHDHRLPRAGDLRPLDLEGDPQDALDRLDIRRAFGERLAGWFIDAARVRGAVRPLAPGDEALLQFVRDDGAEPDWPARLAAVETGSAVTRNSGITAE